MKIWIVAAATAPLCACNIVEDDIARTHDRSRLFDVQAAYMTADARIVTERDHPVTHVPVLCVEPSPDAIKAISTSGAGGLKGGNGAITAGIDLSGTSGEAAGELAGRSTAILGLREGLFRACEAYSNGIIGADAYGLILAKYAPTMTTLFLGQDITGASGVARTALATEAASQGSANPPDAPATAGAKATKTNFPMQSGEGSGVRIWPIAAMTHDAARHDKPKKSASKPGSSAATADASPAATAALALVRMNEDYMLQPTLINTLLVACIEEFDQTRAAYARVPKNSFLMGLCNDLDNLDKVIMYEKKLAMIAGELHLVEPTPVSDKNAGRTGSR